MKFCGAKRTILELNYLMYLLILLHKNADSFLRQFWFNVWWVHPSPCRPLTLSTAMATRTWSSCSWRWRICGTKSEGWRWSLALEQISWLGPSAVALHGGNGVACPSGEVTSLHSVHSSSHRSLSPSTLLNCLFLALNLKGKLICTQSMQSLLSRELPYLKQVSLRIPVCD